MSKKKANAKPAATRGTSGSARAGIGGGPMDVSLLEQITRLMRDNDLSAVELRDGEKRIIVKRGAEFVGPAVPAHHAYAYPAPSAPHAGVPSGQAATARAADAHSGAAAAPDSDAGLVPVKSPMVGTFYSSASPDAKPFVSVGTVVDEETDVCIIEAMKVFNNIKAETKGTIAKVLITNGQTVEFGQSLFLVKPS